MPSIHQPNLQVQMVANLIASAAHPQQARQPEAGGGRDDPTV